MPSSIDIASNALILVGDEPINSFSDPGAGALAAANLYPQVKQRFLSFHPWTWALKQQRLNLLTAAPDDLSGFDFAFQLPTDLIRLWNIQPYQNYRIIGDLLYANQNTGMLATYVFDVDEPNIPAHGVKALEYLLASELAISVTEDEDKAVLYSRKADTMMAQASNIDSQGHPQDSIISSPFIEARLGGFRTGGGFS